VKPETRERLGLLLEKHLEGGLSDPEAAELARSLEGSDEALGLYLETVEMHVDLGNRLAPEPARMRLRRPRFRPRGSTWPRWAAAAVLLGGALGAAFLAGRRPDPPAPPTAAPAAPSVEKGEAVARVERGELRRKDGSRIAPGAGLALGEVIETPEGGAAALLFGDGTRLELSGRTRTGISGARGVHLVAGKVAAQVAPKAGGPAFVFTTPHAEATVLGTRLTLSAEAVSTRLDVQEGLVQLKSHGEARAVGVAAGFYAKVEGRAAPRLFASGEPPPLMAAGGIRATYFDDNRGTGRTVERVDPGVELRLDAGGNELPPVGSDRNFAVRWEGKILAEEEGEYLFIFSVDGQAKLVLGAEVLLADDRALFHPIHRTLHRRTLAAGWHDLVVEYADDRENSHCTLRFVPPGMKPRPGDAFQGDDSGYAIPARLFAHRK
jgi:ferric-dicitrate binding protein FerR (iron transport regulator)